MDSQLREKAGMSLILVLDGNWGSDIQLGASTLAPSVELMNLQEDYAP